MKTNIKKLLFFACMISLITSCKKVEGPQGEQGEQGIQGEQGPQAKTYNFNLNFGAGDTFQSYTGIKNDFNEDDVILTFVEYDQVGGNPTYVQLPFEDNGISWVADFIGNDGTLYISIFNSSNGSSVISSSTLISCKAVLIKSSSITKNPNLDLSSYKAVEKAFNI